VLVLLGEDSKRLGWELHAEGSTHPHRTVDTVSLSHDRYTQRTLQGQTLDPGVAMGEKWSYSKLLYLHCPPSEHSSLLLYAVVIRPWQVRSNYMRHLQSWFVNSTPRRTLSPLTGSSCYAKTFCISVMKHFNELRRATYRELNSCPINGLINDQISGQDNDRNGATCLVKSARVTRLVSRCLEARH